MRTILILIIALTLVGCACQAEHESSSATEERHVEISVLMSGQILIDGIASTIDQVDERLTQLKSEGGTVWYYREAGQQEPPPEAMQIIKMVVENELPISLSSKPDFSDYIGEDGQPRPRE